MNRDRFWIELEKVHAEAERFCRRLSATREDGDDLYQQAILRAHSGCDGLADPSAFRPWFYRLIVNHFKNRRRGAWWRHFVPLTSELEESLPGADPSGKHWADRQLARAFAAVTPEERALITLREIEGWAIAELAKLYKRPEGTIKARLSRARRRMRNALLREPGQTEKPLTANIKLVEAPICVVTKPESE
jgi:RNA polymerase sigma-70 factor (ECF subfamily)